MLKRVLFIPIALLIFCGGICAQNYLVVNGSKSFVLSDVQKITFSNGNMIVTTTSSSDSFVLSSLNGFNFSNTEIITDAEAIKASSVSIQLSNSALFVSGAQGSLAAIYNMGGAVMYMQTLPAEAVISICDYPSGIYILSVNGRTFKFMKR